MPDDSEKRLDPTGQLEPALRARQEASAAVDLGRLAEWMDGQGFRGEPIADAHLLSGGTQNLLLRFRRGGRTFVLRRPPKHLRKNSNETMRREARVLAAIADTPVPHPRLIAACPETDVLGVAFYLMEPVEGFNPTLGLPAYHRSDPAIRRAMGFSLVDSVAALGRVDYRDVGLEGFGRPEGYLERQVVRWRSQLEGYSAFAGYRGAEIPGVDDVARWLDDNRPADFCPGIIHGDYHLANVMYRSDAAELAAIVDWELSTIGDPLLDLGWLLATWPAPDAPSAAAVGAAIQPWDGFPKAEELVARYAEGSQRDVSQIGWYEVLACYKLGIILEGTHARACAGKAPKATGDLLHATTIGLFQRALRRVGAS
jgi:aminoglycoside phosphotransferase (APT) family kinase protein